MEINFSLQRAKHGLIKLSTGETKTTEQLWRGVKEATDDMTVFTQMQDEVFSLNLVLKYVWLSEILIWSTALDCAKPDHSEPDDAKANQGLHGQVQTKESRELHYS